MTNREKWFKMIQVMFISFTAGLLLMVAADGSGDVPTSIRILAIVVVVMVLPCNFYIANTIIRGR